MTEAWAPASTSSARTVRFSANLGFLWMGLPLPESISAAASAGFDAVECHVPFDADPAEIRSSLDVTGLPMVSLNTRSGDPAAGERGLAAVVGQTAEARVLIDEAVDYAASIGCANVHVLAGIAKGPDARRTYVDNLAYAGERAGVAGVGILIEPINQRDMPGYFLSSVDEACEIAATAGPNVRVMFDCYHVQIEHGDLLRRFEQHLPSIGHVQFASVPDRSEPDQGEVDYGWLLPRFYSAGYDGFVGAEYRPSNSSGSVEDSLDWMRRFE